MGRGVVGLRVKTLVEFSVGFGTEKGEGESLWVEIGVIHEKEHILAVCLDGIGNWFGLKIVRLGSRA